MYFYNTHYMPMKMRGFNFLGEKMLAVIQEKGILELSLMVLNWQEHAQGGTASTGEWHKPSKCQGVTGQKCDVNTTYVGGSATRAFRQQTNPICKSVCQ